MNICLISLFDPTPIDKSATGRYIQIAKYAIERGHKVKHYTSTFRHTTKSHRFDHSVIKNYNDNYWVDYIYSFGYKKNNSLRRFISHWVFAKKLKQRLSKSEKPDIILLSLPPISLADVITQWAKVNKIPIVVDIIDPWPDSFIKDIPQKLRGIAQMALFPYKIKLKKILQNSSGLIAISNGYVDWAISNLPSYSKPRNYFYPAIDYSRIKNELNSLQLNTTKANQKLRIIYAGSLASSYDIETICKAAEIVHHNFPNKTEFVFAGTGTQQNIIEEYKNRIPNIVYLGWINADELLKQYFLSDLGLIQHVNSLTQTVTYKFFSYLSAGLPILNSLQSEMVGLINKYQIGLNNSEGDYLRLSENIQYFIEHPDALNHYKKNAQSFCAQFGDSKIVYNQLLDFIEEIKA